MLRFSQSDDSPSLWQGSKTNRRRKSADSTVPAYSTMPKLLPWKSRLRLPLMFLALFLVLAARARLERPEVHEAIGRILKANPESDLDKNGSNKRGNPLKVNTSLLAALANSSELISTESVSSVAIASDESLNGSFDPELLATIRDNTPFRTAEQKAWFTMLASLQHSSYVQQASQSEATVGYATLVSEPNFYRGKLVTVVGKPRRIEKVSPAENELGITQLYRITIEPIGGDVWPITIYTLMEPKLSHDELNSGKTTTTPTICTTGYFFKNQSYRWAKGVGTMPVILAKDISRNVLPTEKIIAEPTSFERETEFPISVFTSDKEKSLGRALLADLGVNLDAYNKIKDQRAFAPEETDAFYATLSALKKTPARQLARLAEGGLASYAARHGEVDSSTAPINRQAVMRRLVSNDAKQNRYSAPLLFGDAAELRGELLSFDGIVRRVVRIEVPDQTIDHYYELELFPEDSQNLPLVFCMTDLPNGFPVGESIRLPARLVGFFFKQWAYRSRNRETSAETKSLVDARRFAPLLLGRSPIPIAVPDASTYRPGLAMGIFGTGFLAFVIFGIWFFARSDQKYEQRVTAKLRDVPLGDFSHLP